MTFSKRSLLLAKDPTPENPTDPRLVKLWAEDVTKMLGGRPISRARRLALLHDAGLRLIRSYDDIHIPALQAAMRAEARGHAEHLNGIWQAALNEYHASLQTGAQTFAEALATKVVDALHAKNAAVTRELRRTARNNQNARPHREPRRRSRRAKR